ncbi:glycerophosphodiester phosphodiesterase family protein [Fulvivirgaceae bacterium LMO-SS25]
MQKRILSFLYVVLFFGLACSSQAQQLKTISINNAAETSLFLKWNENRVPMISAHRGGPMTGFPENCIETFENTIKYTHAIIECDIVMTADGHLVMMHDNTLDRTTNGTGRVNEVTLEYVQSLYLKDNEGNLTDFQVPTLREVLEWGKGKVVFTLDVKRGVPLEKVTDLIVETETSHLSIMITYNMDAAKQVHELIPDLPISMSLGSMDAIEQWRKSGIPAENVVAFVGTSERDAELYEILHKEGIYCILGTMGNLDRSAATNGDELYTNLIRNGADILSTDRPVEAAKALAPLINTESRFYQRFFKN